MWTMFPSLFSSSKRQQQQHLTKYSILMFRVWSFLSVEKYKEQRKGKNLPWIAILNSGVLSRYVKISSHAINEGHNQI